MRVGVIVLAGVGPKVGPGVGVSDGTDVADGMAVEASRTATLSDSETVVPWGLPQESASRARMVRVARRAWIGLEVRRIRASLSQVIDLDEDALRDVEFGAERLMSI